MISSLSVKLARRISSEPQSPKDPTKSVTTIQKIYEDDTSNSGTNNRNDIEFLRVDPETRKATINKSAYSKLHRSSSENTNYARHSVEGLKVRFQPETSPLVDQVAEEKPELRKKPVLLPKPRHLLCKSLPEGKLPESSPPVKPLSSSTLSINEQNKNSNNVQEEGAIELASNSSSRSFDSIDLIDRELSDFVMDHKSNKEHKRTNSFRKIFSVGFFGQKDKKKKDEDKNTRSRVENRFYNDNSQNEANPNRRVEYDSAPPQQYQNNPKIPDYEGDNKVKEVEKKYADMHISRFNQIRQNFVDSNQKQIPQEQPKKKSIADFIDRPVPRYIDSSSSSASMESDRPAVIVRQSSFRNDSYYHRNTPPRAQETYHNFQPIKPIRAQIPINSERPLPNPYQVGNERTTIERNLNKPNDKPPINGTKELIEDTYGTVFDSLTPKSPTLEGSKLRLPPNREILEVQPRVKSPIPTNQVSTDKLIATELLRSARSPTPPKRINSRLSSQEMIMSSNKPPMSPKILQKKPSEISINNQQNELPNQQIITNAIVHSPTPSQLDNVSLRSMRSPTPNELRKTASLKLSPQKGEIRKSVEEYYWKELKKLKDHKDYQLYMMQINDRQRRSRSVSPSQVRGRRSLSLPREVPQTFLFNEQSIYATRVQPQPIPEHDVVDRLPNPPVQRRINYEQPQLFIRNQVERRTFNGGELQNSLQRPIFRRGSLNKPEDYYENQPYKKVSFSSSQQAWPTRNGYTQSPPQRRIDKRESTLDDEVFLPNNSQNYEEYYQYHYPMNEPIYGLIPQQNYRLQQIPRAHQPQAIYVTRSQVALPPQARRAEPIYGQLPQSAAHQNSPSSRRSLADSSSPYNSARQVTVSNKTCDFYGQIHDVPQQSTGVLMGQLQQGNPVAVRYNNQPYPVNNNQNQNFPRGSRLTSSANDMGRRANDNVIYYRDDNVQNYNEMYANSFDNRPLPPTPTKNDQFSKSHSKGQQLLRRPHQVSDTESGSDASEVQRIMMQSKSKSKKRGFFGK